MQRYIFRFCFLLSRMFRYQLVLTHWWWSFRRRPSSFNSRLCIKFKKHNKIRFAARIYFIKIIKKSTIIGQIHKEFLTKDRKKKQIEFKELFWDIEKNNNCFVFTFPSDHYFSWCLHQLSNWQRSKIEDIRDLSDRQLDSSAYI